MTASRPVYKTEWVFLSLVFLLALRAWAPVPAPVQIALESGVLALFLFAFLVPPHPKGRADQEPIPAIPLWAWGTLLVGGLLLRLHGSGDLSPWPDLDEGRTAYFALRQDLHWDWKLLYGYNQLPPLFYWLFSLFLRLVPPSLPAIGGFALVLSLAALGLGALAARWALPRSQTFLAVAFGALGFWPVYAGRFAVEGLLVLVWELLAFVVLALFHRSPGTSRALLLGGVVGLGFYSHLHWPGVALFTALAFLWILQGLPARGPKAPLLAAFLLPSLLIPLPLLFAVLRSSYGDYLHYLVAPAAAGGGPLHPMGLYLDALLWGLHLDYFGYRPYWGGLLDPLTGALTLLGLAGMLRERGGLALGTLLGIPLFLLPGFLTHDLETFRVIPLLPLLFLAAARGAALLLTRRPAAQRPWFLAALLLAVTGLSAFHLFKAYPSAWGNTGDWSKNFKTYPFYAAYQALAPLAKEQGPGAVLFADRVASNDRTLAVATYPFDACGDPALDTAQVRWMAFFQWDDEDAYLSRRFPGSSAADLGPWPEDLSEGLQWIHRLRLRLVRVDGTERASLAQWIAAERCLREASFQELNRPTQGDRTAVLEALREGRDHFQNDPWRATVYGDRLAAFELEAGRAEEARGTLEEAIHLGIPRAALLHRLAVLQVKAGEYGKAYGNFLEAGRRDPLFKPPAGLLRKLSPKPGR